MISNIELHNFGKIKSLHLDCKDNNVFIIGPNGSGKTTILQAISLALTGKTAKGIPVAKFIGPFDKDFLVKITLDDGTIIGRTSKGAKLKTKDNRVFNKVKDVYEHLSFDPNLLFSLSYVRQGEIADLFMGGSGKIVVDKLISLLINTKRLNEAYSEITKRYNSSKKEKDFLAETLSNLKKDLELKDIKQVEKEIEETVNTISKIYENSKYSEEELKSFTDIHQKYDLAKLSYAKLKETYLENKDKVNRVVKPKTSLKELSEKLKEYNLYKKKHDKIVELEEDLEYWMSMEKHFKTIEKYYSIDLKLVKKVYTIEALEEIKKDNCLVMSCMTTSESIPKENAKKVLERYVNNYGIDGESILHAKQIFEEVRNELRPFQEQIREMTSKGAKDKDFKEVYNEIVQEKRKVISNLHNELESSFESIPEKVEESDYERISSEWNEYDYMTNLYKTSLEELNDIKHQIEYLNKKVSTIPSKDDIIATQSSLETIHSYEKNLSYLKKQIEECHFIENKIEDIEEQIKLKDNYIERLHYWKEVISSTPNKLRETLFNPVVSCLNKQFYELFSFSGLGEISIDWNTVSIKVGGKDFEQCSGAQMVAIGLSMRLALLQVMGSYAPIMLIDEPTVFLDDQRKYDVKRLLSYMSKYSQSFVCTHDDAVIESSNSILVNTSQIV